MTEQNRNEDAARAFSAFHDGGISFVAAVGDAIEAKIDIQYLAERVDPSFRSFYIELQECRNLRFEPWAPKGGLGNELKNINEIKEVNSLDLEILSATVEAGEVHVECLVHASNQPIQGGQLVFAAGELNVTDQLRRTISTADLLIICEDYWAEWEEKSRRAQGENRQDETS